MKIPQIRSTEPLSARQPPQVNPSVYSLPARAGIGLGEAISGAGSILMDQEIKIKEGKRKVEQALSLQGGIDEYRTRMDDFDSNLQKIPDKSNYAERVRQGSLEIQNDIFKKIKDTKVQDALKIKFSDLGTDYYIKARDYENKYFISTKRGKALEKVDSISKRAGMAPSIEETVGIGSEGIRLIDELTGTIFSPEEASKMKIKLSDDIEKHRLASIIARADMAIFQNPDKADEILQMPEYSMIPEDKKVTLLNKGIAREERIQKKIEKDEKEKSERRYASILESIDKGIDMEESIRLEGPNRVGTLRMEEFEKALKANEVTQKAIREGDWNSNPNMEADIEKRLYVANPTITEKEIWEKSRPGGISRSKASKYSIDLRTRDDHLQSLQRTEGNERRSEVNRLYGQAENYIERGLGVYGIISELYESLDPSQKKALRFSKDELWRRSAGGRGKEDPAIVADEILPRYQKMLHDEGLIEMKNIEAGLIYRDFDEMGKSPKLELDYKAGKVSKGTYDVQKQMLYERKRKFDLLGEVPNPLEQPKPGKKTKGPFK